MDASLLTSPRRLLKATATHGHSKHAAHAKPKPTKMHRSHSAPSALTRLRSITSGKSALILAFYRGGWCPFCTDWARGLSAIRSLSERLGRLDAQVVFVCAQALKYEKENAQQFRFDTRRGLREGVHFVNDENHEIASWVKNTFGKAVYIQKVNPEFTSGNIYKNGMTQPAVLLVEKPFQENVQHVSYWYSSQVKDSDSVNGDDDHQPACTTFRKIENILKHA